MPKLKPPENYRWANGKENCGNCTYSHKIEIVIAVQWYSCERPGATDTYAKFVCDGHKRIEREAADE